MTSSTTPQSSLPQSLLDAHPPQIVMRAAWYTELTGQEATYFPSFVGNQYWDAPPAGNPPAIQWRSVRDGVLTQETKTLINLAVILEGTQWLKDEQPVSWAVEANDYVTLQTDTQFGMTSVYGDQLEVATLVPNMPIPDPNNVHAAGKLGRAVTITGTYADSSTIIEMLVIHPFSPNTADDVS